LTPYTSDAIATSTPLHLRKSQYKARSEYRLPKGVEIIPKENIEGILSGDERDFILNSPIKRNNKTNPFKNKN
jgi:hypothetical protein